MRSRVNSFALFAGIVGTISVVSNWALAGSTPWLLGALGGLVAGMAGWTYPRRCGALLAAAAGVLLVVGVTTGPTHSDVQAMSSGACAGVLLGVLVCQALGISRRK